MNLPALYAYVYDLAMGPAWRLFGTLFLFILPICLFREVMWPILHAAIHHHPMPWHTGSMSTHPAPLPKPNSLCISGLTDCGYALSQTFPCTQCKRTVCWCSGGDEDDRCAECSNQEHDHGLEK